MLKMVKPGFSETTLNSLNNEDHQHFQGLVQCLGSIILMRILILEPIQCGLRSCILSGADPDSGSSPVRIVILDPLKYGLESWILFSTDMGSCILSGTAPDTGSSRVKIRFKIHLRFHSFIRTFFT